MMEMLNIINNVYGVRYDNLILITKLEVDKTEHRLITIYKKITKSKITNYY